MTDWRGSGLILVIDDHELVCEVLRHILERHGFTVLTATDGPTGVALFQRHVEEVKVVLLDLVLPGMSGAEVLQAIRAIHPGVRVLLLTGRPVGEVQAEFAHMGVTGYIQKSFQLAPFIAELQRVLEE